ncbi:MAG: type II secretion system F family protein, partial [Candidatus Hydrogenedentes bacterium]|nr:type II secretion system F family protein [Candidatus Hydrogenedentota bacterium]
QALATCTAQLSLMLRTGTSLVDALDALAEQTQDVRLYNVLVSVRGQVAGGSTLAAALGGHPEAFDAFYVSAVRSGEATGRLPEVFARLEQTLRKRVEIRSSLLVAMIYPTVVSLMATFAVIFVMTYVLPKFIAIFKSSNVPLPVPTRMLMSMSNFLVSYWYIVLLAVIVLPAGTYLYITSPKGSRVFDGLVLRLPIFGYLTNMLQTSLMLRTVGTLISSGVPLVEGLEVAQEACKNTRFKALIRDVSARITQGEDLSASFGRSDLLAPTIKQMLTTGERSGNLAKVMNSMAEFLDDETDKQLKKLSAIFEPLIIIAMGIVVGFIAVSILLPLFKLTAAARGGA